MLSSIIFFMNFAVFDSYVIVNIMDNCCVIFIFICCFIANFSTFHSTLGSEGQYASAQQMLLCNRSIRFRDIVIIQIIKMTAAAILNSKHCEILLADGV